MQASTHKLSIVVTNRNTPTPKKARIVQRLGHPTFSLVFWVHHSIYFQEKTKNLVQLRTWKIIHKVFKKKM